MEIPLRAAERWLAGDAAVPRERVQLAAGRHPALPVPAIRAALLRAPDGAAPDAGRRRSPSRSCWRPRSPPAGVSDPVALAAARARLATLRRVDLRGQRPDCSCSRRSCSCSIEPPARAVEPAVRDVADPAESGAARRRPRDARRSDQGLAAARLAVRPSTSAARRARRRARGRAHRRRHAGPHRDRRCGSTGSPSCAWPATRRGISVASRSSAVPAAGRRLVLAAGLPGGGLVRATRAGGRVDRRPVGGRLAVAPHLRAAVPRAGDARHPSRGGARWPRSSSRRTPTTGRGPDLIVTVALAATRARRPAARRSSGDA